MSEIHHHTITVAEPNEASDIAHMQRQSWIDTYIRTDDSIQSTDYNGKIKEYADTFVLPERIALRESVIAESKESVDTVYLAATDSQRRIVGMLYGWNKPEGQEIHALYADKAQRGQGIGRALVERFIDWSDKTKPIQLGVLQDNHHAIGFYKKMKFTEVPDSISTFQGNAEMKEIKMIRNADEEIRQ